MIWDVGVSTKLYIRSYKNMARKTMKQIRFEEVRESGLEQLKMFCRMCHFARVNGAFGGNGITKKDLYDRGMTDKVFQFLVSNHYCSVQKPGKPLWVSINGNKFYPDKTVQNLEKMIAQFEAEK